MLFSVALGLVLSGELAATFGWRWADGVGQTDASMKVMLRKHDHRSLEAMRYSAAAFVVLAVPELTVVVVTIDVLQWLMGLLRQSCLNLPCSKKVLLHCHDQVPGHA